jgi:D-tyrosyl-tRNA(Tyr) deacylase
MRFVIQRVDHATVTIHPENGPSYVKGSIEKGFLVLIGVTGSDTRAIADAMIKKLLGLRIFPDENDKTNLDLKTVDGQLLLISQFTLYADCRKGNRPSFTDAAEPVLARELYDYITEKCAEQVPHVDTGSFGEHMTVDLQNNGPFTIILDSDDIHIS